MHISNSSFGEHQLERSSSIPWTCGANLSHSDALVSVSASVRLTDLVSDRMGLPVIYNRKRQKLKVAILDNQGIFFAVTKKNVKKKKKQANFRHRTPDTILLTVLRLKWKLWTFFFFFFLLNCSFKFRAIPESPKSQWPTNTPLI